MTTNRGGDGEGRRERERDRRRRAERDRRAGDDATVAVDVWVRCVPDTATERTNAVLARLARLRTAGAVDAVSIRTWDNAIDRTAAPAGDCDACEEFARFEAWATAHGHRLAVTPALTAGRGRMGPEYVAQSSPWVLVAVRRDGELVDVAPTVDGRRTRSVSDLLDAIDGGDHPGTPRRGPGDDPLDQFGTDWASRRPGARRTRSRRRWGPIARRRAGDRRFSNPVV